MSNHIINFNSILSNNISFSASLYEQSNNNYEISKKLSEFLINPPFKGKEVGSEAYISDKSYKFIRTSNIPENSFLFDDTSCVGIAKKFFINHDLKKNQILIVKDGSLGNVAFINKDYNDCMLCAGINILSCIHPFYIFSILQHHLFKENFNQYVAKGSTLAHAKNIYLNFDIPLPKDNDESIIKFVENIMESIIYKESLIKEKIDFLNGYISDILNFNDFDNIGIKYPIFDDLKNIKRLDAGYYSIKSIYIRNLIQSYKNGYFYLDKCDIGGGNTPKIRSNPSHEHLEYMWFAPKYINGMGLNNNICFIDFKGKNNINFDTCLIINRTSKKKDGQSGKYVGISHFYDYSIFGKAHHNQGFYHIKNHDKIDLLVLVSLLNHPLYREYFGEISSGSKMKEIKKYNLIDIPFPKFDVKIKQTIKELYYNEKEYVSTNLTNENFMEYDKIWSNNAGIYDLYILLVKQKAVLNKIICKIYNNSKIVIDYSF